jgi:hypothetical protein
VQAVSGELRAIRGTLIDVHMRQSQLWSSGLHEKFNALFDSVDSADYRPPRQAREVFARLRGQLDELRERCDRVVTERIPLLDQAVRTAGLTVIGPAG